MVSVATAMSGSMMGAMAGAPRAAMRDAGPDPAPVTLRISGGKPLKLRAALLAEGNSWSPGTPLWHEVSLWHREGGEIAVSVTTFRKAQGETDIFRAEVFPNLAEALAWLEGFDPTADLTVDLDASDRSVSALEIALRAAALRGRADEVARQWRALLGEMLFRLDASA